MRRRGQRQILTTRHTTSSPTLITVPVGRWTTLIFSICVGNQVIDVKNATNKITIYSLIRQETLFCTLCLWVQPNFAVHFGFGSLSAGISETIQLVELLSWVFRALDINMDTVPDSIALILGQVLVQDLPNLPLTNASSGDATKTTLIELSGSGGAGHKLKYSTKIASINPTTTLPFLESQLPQKFSKGKNNKCCATLSFVYHDIPKVLSVTSLRNTTMLQIYI